jgi:hypothetical protein
MKHLFILFSLLVFIGVSSCTQKEGEEEPDYDNMVMADEEENEWTPGQEKDAKVVADLDPQEFIINDPELKTENACGELLK